MNRGLTFNKFLIYGIAVLVVIFSLPSKSFAGWLIYHKPEFRGRVIDAETKEPIEGAVVVAIYKKHTLISGPGGGYSSVIKVKETLTDKKGEFYFPSYTTIIQPLSIEDYVEFIIYKPGYGSFSDHRVSPPKDMSLEAIERFFSEEVGKQGEIIEDEPWRKWTVTFGIVELPMLKTWEERNKANMISISDISKGKWPLLYEMIEKEAKWLKNNKGWRR